MSLRLIAQDPADVEVLSAALQDSVLKLKDAAFARSKRAFTIALNRYRWEAAGDGPGERVRAGLAVNGVLGVQTCNVRQDAGEAVAQILALRFEPDGEPPGGALTLTLAGGGAIRLQVECVDAVLADVSAPWPARARPDHGDA